MKAIKKDRTFNKSYRPVVLYIDNLNELLLALDAGKPEISTSAYQFESVEELKDHFGPQRLFDLKIGSSNPSVSINFSRIDARLYVFGSPTSAQAFYEIDEILRRCERRPRFLYHGWLFLLPSVWWGISQVWDPKFRDIPLSLFLVGISFPLVFWNLFVNTRRHSMIVLQRRHEASSFLKRNRDAIWMNILSAIGGGLVTFFGTHLKDKFLP